MQLQEILATFREGSRSETEKGEYFERLVRIFLLNDDIQKQYYTEVLPFAEWAKSNGWKNADTGIDLVATLSDGSGYAQFSVSFMRQITVFKNQILTVLYQPPRMIYSHA